MSVVTLTLEQKNALNHTNVSQNEMLSGTFETYPFLSPELVKFLNIPNNISQFVRVFDEIIMNDETHLLLVHYTAEGENHPELHQFRGTIVARKGEDNSFFVVAKSFPHTPESVLSSDVASNFTPNSNTLIFEAFEGTILRVFNYGGSWFISTHKKINGVMSRWGPKTFGELFAECWNIFDDTTGFLNFDELSKTQCYIFLLSCPENSLVTCVVGGKKLYHLATYTSGNNTFSFEKNITHKNVLYPKQSNISDLQTQDFKTNSGVMFIEVKENTQGYEITGCYKYTTEQYDIRRQLRGNEPNLRVRIIDLTTLGLLEVFKQAFSYNSYLMKIVKDVERQKERLPFYLYEAFECRYVNGKYLRLPKEIHYFLDTFVKNGNYGGLVGKYLLKREKDMVRARIIDALNTMNIRTYNGLLKHIKTS